MLDLARKSAGAEAHRCDFRLGDLEHLPVADGEADAVLACMVLHHVSAPPQALKEAGRALASGGELAVIDLARHTDESLRDQLADLWLGFQPDQMRRWLQAAGFEVIEAGTAAPDSEAIQLITFRGKKP